MHIILFDRPDRLGSNITNYLAQIICAHKLKMIIKFTDNDKEKYMYYHSIFIQILFKFIDEHNKKMLQENIIDDNLVYFISPEDYFLTISVAIEIIKNDYVSYFKNFIYNDIDILDIKNKYNIIPFDINKTILVHLRLDDTAHYKDYDGSICSNYYKEKINNNKTCYYTNNNNNFQAPLSKLKIENIIAKAKEKYIDYEVILLTSPCSDTSDFSYKTIKNDDESYDLYLLSLCKVVILSRSTFSISSLFFNNDKEKVYIPLWGHTAILGFDTIYDNNDKSIYEYFY